MSKWQWTWDFHVDFWLDVLDQMIWSLQTMDFYSLNQGQLCHHARIVKDDPVWQSLVPESAGAEEASPCSLLLQKSGQQERLL